MLEKLEFDEVKKIRKSLIVTSATGIIVSQLIKYSTSEINFLGFKIPKEDASIISNLIGFIVIYYITSLLIRFFDEEFGNFIKKRQSEIIQQGFFPMLTQEEYDRQRFLNSIQRVIKAIKWSKYFLDLIFPIALGVTSLFFSL